MIYSRDLTFLYFYNAVQNTANRWGHYLMCCPIQVIIIQNQHLLVQYDMIAAFESKYIQYLKTGWRSDQLVVNPVEIQSKNKRFILSSRK